MLPYLYLQQNQVFTMKIKVQYIILITNGQIIVPDFILR